MEAYTSETVRHFATASYFAGALDEIWGEARAHDAFEAWLARGESIAIAKADGFAVDTMEFARAASEEVATNIEKGVKSALDALRARRLVSTWTLAPSAEIVLELHLIASKSAARRLDADAELRLQDGAAEVASLLATASEAADLREAARVLGSTLFVETFAGNARRMRLLIAPWLAGRVLSLRKARIPMAASLIKEMDRDGEFQHDWATAFAKAMESGTRLAIDGLRNVRLLGEALCLESKVESKGSSISSAVDFFIGHPMATASDIEKALGLTRRGANLVIDRMVTAGVLESAYPDRTKNRVFICRRALTI